MSTVLSAITTGAAAAISISLWTFRVALAARGRKALSATIAGIEAVLFVVIFTGLVANLGDPVRIFGYALGVAGGTLLGLAADERLSPGQSEVRLILPGDGSGAIERLLQAGWPATWSSGVGPNGPTTTVFLVIDDRRRDELFALIDRFDPSTFVTVERLRHVRPVSLPAGFVQVGAGRRARTPRRSFR
jgi:uncharacterized protein YebE (UPF0316 family)